MDHTVLPLIAKEDYAGFRAIVADLPDTYEEWQETHNKKKIDLRNRGDEAKEVQVQLAKFSDFCRDRGQQPTLVNLWRFAMEEIQPPEVIGDYDPLEDA